MGKYKILITGSSGFVGRNLIDDFGDKFVILRHFRNDVIKKDVNCFIHLAGKAHDLNKASSFCDYYEANTELTKKIYKAFIASKAKVFIWLSSVKAVADRVDEKLTEDAFPNPVTDYGKSKLLAEKFVLSQFLPAGKRVYILRPCMIHGPGNNGNLKLLYNMVSKGLPWPLGKYLNLRSYLSIGNLCFIIKELIEREDIPSGVYNIADDEPLSTNEVICQIAESIGKKAKIFKINKSLILTFARIGDYLKLPFNTERLQKLTENYVVCNRKIITVIGKPLPVSSKEGLLKTFQSFSSND